MNFAYLALMGVFTDRNRRSLRSNRPEGRLGQGPGRLLGILFGWLRAQSPPVDHLSNHLRRDIGLGPVAEQRDWGWYR